MLSPWLLHRCKDNSCPDAGIRVPAIPFDSSEFYGFSEFWYSTEDVLKMGGPYLLSKHKQASSVSNTGLTLSHCFVAQQTIVRNVSAFSGLLLDELERDAVELHTSSLS